MTPLHPSIILLRPQLPENIGGIARVMKNFGFDDLRMIMPQCDHLSHLTMRCAAGAGDVLENAHVFTTLQDAITDIQHLYGTIDKPRDLVGRYEGAKNISAPHNLKSAILFGPERTGLERNDMMYCQSFITIPTITTFSSLNIVQAVGILCYQLSDVTFQNQLITNETTIAAGKHRIHLQEEVESLLDTINYWRTAPKKKRMLQNMTAFINRIDFTHQDIQSLRGILKTLRDLAKQPF